jgi:hypothetical protein
MANTARTHPTGARIPVDDGIVLEAELIQPTLVCGLVDRAAEAAAARFDTHWPTRRMPS